MASDEEKKKQYKRRQSVFAIPDKRVLVSGFYQNSYTVLLGQFNADFTIIGILKEEIFILYL